jgi:NAD(P)-dependent dehydrogenase (short-subunit alcohol dehydrogenase family)
LADWGIELIPDQTGKTYVVTGASSGLGLCCADALLARGAHVIMAVRDTAKGRAAAEMIRRKNAHARIEIESLNLSSLASVSAFAARINSAGRQIDVLLNNAGLGKQPMRLVTEDGFEQQFGTNHLGHFALTAHLVPALLRAEQPRVVTVASIAHRRGTMHWQDPNYATGYNGAVSYSQSKLANLMFALELARRATAQGARIASLAAHPGLAATPFVAATRLPAWQQMIGVAAIRLIGQTAAEGAWPLLYAAAMPDARNGDYWGPCGFLEIRGAPARARCWPQAKLPDDWARLWSLSETLTGITFPSLV